MPGGKKLLHEERKIFNNMLTHSTTEIANSKSQLMKSIQDNIQPLLGTLRAYVQRFGLASGAEVYDVALEVLQDTVIEALDSADRFISAKSPMAWLLGIAINVIKRKKVEKAKRYQRELLFSHLSERYPELSDESDLLDQLIPPSSVGTEQTFVANEQAQALLSLVPAEDQEILRLAILEDVGRESLAQRLGIPPGTARMRLHRALRRLRSAWQTQQTMLMRGESNE